MIRKSQNDDKIGIINKPGSNPKQMNKYQTKSVIEIFSNHIKTLASFSFLAIFGAFFSCSTAAPLQSGAEIMKAEPTAAVSGDLADRVVIRRTEYGIPHILAENIKAAGFAMGYVQMEDYGDRVSDMLIRAKGQWARYSEIEPDRLSSAIDSDAVNRLLHQRAVETWHKLEQDTRDLMEGFADGVNLYIDLNPDEFSYIRTPIFTGYDVHARSISRPGGASIRRFMNALENRRNSNDGTETAHLYSDAENRTVWARFAELEETPHLDAGSNVWAFAPERTKSGNAILVRNPHLSWDAGYYEAQIRVPGVLDFYGDFRIGGPLGIIGGFNNYLGWATTNNNPRLDEIYAFEADPEKPDHYLLDGASVPLERKLVDVEYSYGQGTGSEMREFWSTPFGPVFHREDGKIYVIKAAGEGEYRVGEQFLRMMKAENFEEWEAAMRMRARTSSNLTYADAEGNIYYVWNATIPDLPHESGGDTLAIDVTRTEQIWLEPVAWDDLPQLKNPEGGYLRNENDPFHFTNLNEILHEEDYPSYFPEPQFRLRSQHSHELIHNNKVFSLEEIIELKHSMGMLLAGRVKDDLVEAVRSANPEGELLRAIEHIEEWDNTVARGSRGGVLFETWWDRYVNTADSSRVSSSPESVGFSATPEKLFTEIWSAERPAETPRGLADPDRAVEAFKWSVKEATKQFGSWDLAWGDVHRTRIGDMDLPVGGCSGLPGCFRILWFVEHEEDEKKRQVRGGDGWVFAVEFGEEPRAYSVLAYGQSIKEDSPHFNDQLEMFTNNEMKRVALTEEEILEKQIRIYRPGRE